MALLKGTDIQIGIGREGTRGTYQAPSIWLPLREPAGIRVAVDKAPIRETSGQSVPTTGSVVVQTRAEGELVHNIRSSSIGYFLLSLFGDVTTSTITGSVKQHVFNLLTGNPQYPTLSLALSQLGFQDYKYTRSAARQMELRFPKDDLANATTEFVSGDESTQGDFSPSIPTSDHFFRPQDIVVKIAAAVGDLAGASATKLKELSLTINNGARVNQNIGELAPSDVLALIHEITGELSLDYQDETQHDMFEAGTYKAMSITLTRSDVDLGSSNPPSLSIVLPKVSFESYDPDRPIDDIVTEGIGFAAHYDATAGYAARATLVNLHSAYTT